MSKFGFWVRLGPAVHRLKVGGSTIFAGGMRIKTMIEDQKFHCCLS